MSVGSDSAAVAGPAGSLGGWIRAFAVIALCTAIAEAMAPHLDLANIIMVYLAGVVYVALFEGEVISIATVIAGIFLFDLLFVPPRWGLNPLNPSHFFTFAVMLVVGLLISRLATWARRQTELADARARRAQALSSLAQRLAAARTREEIEAGLVQAVRDTFGVRAALAPGNAGSASAAPGALPLQAGSDCVGALVLNELAPSRLAPEDRELLAAFGHQGAVALERCALQERSAAARIEAETERLRNTLLAGISHDFRTPLTTIVGAAATLLEQDQRLDADRRALLARSVLGEARRLHRLVSDLLDLARLQEGAVQLHLEWCPADDLVQEAIAALGERTDRHHLRVDLPADAIVWCDARLVEQATVNMVDNAVRYTPPGTEVRIAVEVDGAEWRLSVADSGPGLPPGREQDVFRKFQRGSGEPASGGIGLGLAICGAAARLHGGRAVARNQPGGGACFTLHLPQPPGPAPGGPP